MFGDTEKEFWSDVLRGRLAERRSWIPSQAVLSELTGIPTATLSVLLRTITGRATVATVLPLALVLDIDLYELARGLELDEPVLRLLEDKRNRKFFRNYMAGHESIDGDDDVKAATIQVLVSDLPPERQEMATRTIKSILNQMK